ncbi:hypothetical protein [Hymenobacter sp. UYCo722]
MAEPLDPALSGHRATHVGQLSGTARGGFPCWRASAPRCQLASSLKLRE